MVAIVEVAVVVADKAGVEDVKLIVVVEFA